MGVARPEPGETRRGGTLLPPSGCSAQPTAPRPRHTRKAERGSSRERPGGEGSCPLPCRCWQSRQRHGRDTRTGGAWPGPGEIRRGRALPSPSCCSVLACSVSAVTHTQAVRSPSGRGPAREGSAPLLSLLAVLGTADSVMAATHTGGARPGPGEARRGGALPLPLRCSEQPTASWPLRTRKAVRGPSLASPCRRDPALPSRCSARPSASRPRHTHRRCAAQARRDPAGKGPPLSL